jgi:hypothetical protein
MIQFYWSIVKLFPLIAWESLNTVLGAFAAICFLLLLFNRPLSQRWAAWEGVSIKWAFVLLASCFVYLVLKTNYSRFQDLTAAKDQQIAATNADRDKAMRRNEIDGAQIEQLTVANAALQQGAPVITGPEARVAEMRTQLLKYADKAPGHNEFSDEAAKAWLSGARRLAGNLNLNGGAPYFDYDAYKGNYESLEETVGLLRAFALNLTEDFLTPLPAQ